MPDKYNFDDLGNKYSCIEENCDLKDYKWNLPDEVRKAHFETHNSFVLVESQKAEVVGKMRQMNCRSCGHSFLQIRRRGRPFLECDNCR